MDEGTRYREGYLDLPQTMDGGQRVVLSTNDQGNLAGLFGGKGKQNGD